MLQLSGILKIEELAVSFGSLEWVQTRVLESGQPEGNLEWGQPEGNLESGQPGGNLRATLSWGNLGAT